MNTARVGDPLSAVDTPALLVDVPAMDRNIEQMLSRFRGGSVSVRPHAKTIKSALLAERLIAAGARGVCVAKLGEAEALARRGIRDVLITTEIVGEPKLARLIELLRGPTHISVVVDSVQACDALERALAAAGLKLEVLIDVDVGQHRTGVLPGAPALALAEHIAKLGQLLLVGLQGYEGHLQQLTDARERDARCRAALTLLTETAVALRRAGHRVDRVTTGGTGTAATCAAHPGITEVQPGSFIFMDTSYRKIVGAEYECALTVLATVISRPRPGEAVVDAGLKSLSTDMGFAEPTRRSGLSYRPAGDEHGILSWAPDQHGELALGERVELIPSHIDTTVNLHDEYVAHRDGRVEALWPIDARGKVQ